MVSARCVVPGASTEFTLFQESDYINMLRFRAGQAMITYPGISRAKYVAPQNACNTDVLPVKRRRALSAPYAYVTKLCPNKAALANTNFVGLSVTALSDPRSALYYDTQAVISVATHGLVYTEISHGLNKSDTVYGGKIFCRLEPNKPAELHYEFNGVASGTNICVGFLVSVIKVNYCAIFLTYYTDGT